MSWPNKKLNTVAELCLGKMLDQNKNKGELKRYLANINVRWGRFELDDLREMRFEETELDRYGLKAGDIVMCEGGEPGRCALWRDEVPGMMFQKALHRIRVRAGLDAQFLLYALLYLGQTNAMEALFTGATIKHLPGEQLAKLEVPVPPIETQRRIASILGAYDDLIEVNRRRVKLLEEMARGLFEEWFVRFRFPGHETIPLLDTPNGKLPEGWEWEKVASVLKKIRRPEKVKTADYLSEGTIPCIDQGSDFVGGYTDNADALISDPLPICVFGDHTRILKFVTFPFASGADGTQLLYPDERISPEYLFLSLEAIDLSNQFYARHFKFLKEQLILIPRHDLVEKFDVIARPALQLIQKFRDQNIKLAASRDLLLPRLISGQLSVEAAEQQLAAE